VRVYVDTPAQISARHRVKCPLLCKFLTRRACVGKLYVVNHDMYDSVIFELLHAYRRAEEKKLLIAIISSEFFRDANTPRIRNTRLFIPGVLYVRLSV